MSPAFTSGRHTWSASPSVGLTLGSGPCPPVSDRLLSRVVFQLWLDASCISGLFLTSAASFVKITTFPPERILEVSLWSF